MKLKCNAICTKVLKKSSSPAFKNLQVGNKIYFSTEIKHGGMIGRGSYATYIECFNPQTKQISRLSFNQIDKTLNNFEFEEEC